MSEAGALSTVVSQVLKSIRQRQGEISQQDWPRIAGKQISNHTKSLGLKDGVLTIIVDHPAWAQQIAERKKRLLDRWNEQVPGAPVNDLSVRVGDR
ncbi:MAG: DUF721 domain-containing protein [Candidatus Omnitrophica bacterium]|nr:DUF721 domain-containing protein [Candidatus Omnitrophota bacterium]